MSERVDAVVVGAGVVGLAVARALALEGREVILLERNERFGAETSSRNSEVIHAGIYYRPGGLRARLCVVGRQRLYAYCQERKIDCRRCGKLIVATSREEEAGLGVIKARAEANGVGDLVRLTGDEARRLEPALRASGALLSPSSGVVDSHALMVSLLGDVEAAGGVLALKAPVVGGVLSGEGLSLKVGGGQPATLEAKLVVNAAGLWAGDLAHALEGLDPATIPAIRPATGRYFSYSGAPAFSRLIYPLPTSDSQGVHYTRDLGGRAKLGPDIVWDQPRGDYSVDDGLREKFAKAARRFWPDLDPERLTPGYAGQRPKATGPGEEGDFLIMGAGEHGVPGYVGLYAIESPGLTSCLAIADYVAAMV